MNDRLSRSSIDTNTLALPYFSVPRYLSLYSYSCCTVYRVTQSDENNVYFKLTHLKKALVKLYGDISKIHITHHFNCREQHRLFPRNDISTPVSSFIHVSHLGQGSWSSHRTFKQKNDAAIEINTKQLIAPPILFKLRICSHIDKIPIDESVFRPYTTGVRNRISAPYKCNVSFQCR